MPTDTQDEATSGNEELILTNLLCELLGLPSVHADASIVALTEDSITILKLVSHALTAGLSIDVVDVFEYNTVAALAQRARENASR